MATNIRIDFVGDVTCPWSYVGFYGLLQTIAGTQAEYNARLYIQPFEMHPDLGAQGVNATEYAMRSQNLPLEHVENAQKLVVQQAAVYGLKMALGPQTRLWNTHAAHRLLYWTGLEGKSVPLMRALYHANFVEQSNISDHAVLLEAVARVELDVQRARAILSSTEFSNDVRAKERSARESNIQRLPTVVLNQAVTIEGAHAPEFYATAMLDTVRAGIPAN